MNKVALALIASVTLVGCAGSPARLGFASAEELAQQSNYNLCRASASMYSNRMMDEEIARRGVDCAPHIAAAAARKQAQLNAGTTMMMMNNQRQPLQPIPDTFPKRTHCENFGNGVQCTQY